MKEILACINPRLCNDFQSFRRNILHAIQSRNIFFHACGSGIKKVSTFAPGEVAEWSIAPVLKTGACNRAGGSNPSLSAECIKRSPA